MTPPLRRSFYDRPVMEVARELLQQQRYEQRTREELHRIWQEVLSDLAGHEVELMVKQLRDRMVMVPL